MLVTREAALKMWCPMTRVPSNMSSTGDIASVNRFLDRAPASDINNCIGERCMMFRVHRSGFYCGLAGVPGV